MVYIPSVPLNYKKIEKLRKKLGLTQEDAATMAGLQSRQHWNNIENGRQTNINVKVLEGIAKALGVRPGELLE